MVKNLTYQTIKLVAGMYLTKNYILYLKLGPTTFRGNALGFLQFCYHGIFLSQVCTYVD